MCSAAGGKKKRVAFATVSRWENMTQYTSSVWQPDRVEMCGKWWSIYTLFFSELLKSWKKRANLELSYWEFPWRHRVKPLCMLFSLSTFFVFIFWWECRGKMHMEKNFNKHPTAVSHAFFHSLTPSMVSHLILNKHFQRNWFLLQKWKQSRNCFLWLLENEF